MDQLFIRFGVVAYQGEQRFDPDVERTSAWSVSSYLKGERDLSAYSCAWANFSISFVQWSFDSVQHRTTRTKRHIGISIQLIAWGCGRPSGPKPIPVAVEIPQETPAEPGCFLRHPHRSLRIGIWVRVYEFCRRACEHKFIHAPFRTDIGFY